MEIYRVSFVGHREIYRIREVEDMVEQIVTDLIRKKEYVEFYVGRNGDFDVLTASAVKRVQKKLGNCNSSLILVLPYSVKDEEYYKTYFDEIFYPIDPQTHHKAAIIKRNEWMIEQSDLVIAFVEKQNGGAYQAMRYAEKADKKVINSAIL